MNNKVLVTAADEKYFPLVLELISSFKSFPQSTEYDIAVMDVGLTISQAKTLKNIGTKLVSPDWPCKIPASRLKGREYIKACVCRPFINKIFPEYDYYLWLDSDTWVQNWEAIDLFEKAASKKAMACTLLVDRGYPARKPIKWFGSIPWKARGFYYSNARKAFSNELAKRLFTHHTVSAGAFAMYKDFPHWQRWQELIIEALKDGNPFTAEQLTLGILIHIENYPAETLPAWCHWVCMDNLKWDEENNMIVEPYLPHKPISIMHLSGLDEMRLNPKVKTAVKTLSGDTIQMSLRYIK